MVSVIHKPNSTLTPVAASMNKGSCHDLVEYLSKEEGGWEACNGFFTDSDDCVSAAEAESLIDSNHHGLKSQDDKFYMLTLNPSSEELSFLVYEATGRAGITDMGLLTEHETALAYDALRDYTRACMDQYAWNYNRPGVDTGSDLVYFAKIETQRHYKGTDPEVAAGEASSGDVKPGLQLHVHVCVSRNNRAQNRMLNPFGSSVARSQRRNPNLPGYFLRKGWDYRNAQTFRAMFGYTETLQFDSGSKQELGTMDKEAAAQYWQRQMRRRARRLSRLSMFPEHSDLLDPPRKAINAARFMMAFLQNPTHALFRKITSTLVTGAVRQLDGSI